MGRGGDNFGRQVTADASWDTLSGMSYTVRIEHFEGPLDLLLQLIEQEELDITSVSLLQVTEPFVAHVRERHGAIPPEELADFLVVAAKLVYLKSKALLPELHDPLLEEGPDLETQLRLYKQYVDAARTIGELAKTGRVSFGRLRPLVLAPENGFHPPSNVSADTLATAFRGIVKKLTPLLALPRASLERAFTIEEKIEELRTRVGKMLRVSFHRVLKESQTRQEMVVSFLALLELVKQRMVRVNQSALFEDIHLELA